MKGKLRKLYDHIPGPEGRRLLDELLKEADIMEWQRSRAPELVKEVARQVELAGCMLDELQAFGGEELEGAAQACFGLARLIYVLAYQMTQLQKEEAK